MDKFIHLTSAQPGVGKIRVNLANICYYFRKGTASFVIMAIPGCIENVSEKVEEIDELVDRAGGIHFKRHPPLSS